MRLIEKTRSKLIHDLLPEVNNAWIDDDNNRFERAMMRLATSSLCPRDHQPRADKPENTSAASSGLVHQNDGELGCYSSTMTTRTITT